MQKVVSRLVYIKQKKNKSGWQINVEFRIALHKKDVGLLKLIQAYFYGVGNLRIDRGDVYVFRVSSQKEISDQIIPHFDKYPLKTNKLADYLLFKKLVRLLINKEHLTIEGLNKAVGFKASVNLGLSQELKESFPNVVPEPRPCVNQEEISFIPFWIAGFTAGEGCFLIKITKSSTHKVGKSVKLSFTLTQHVRDKQLMTNLAQYLGCGRYVPRSKKGATSHIGDFLCTKFDDIYDTLIPFFKKYPVVGVKSKDFQDWCLIAEIVKNGDHLTREGLDKIIKIKAGMNKGREVE